MKSTPIRIQARREALGMSREELAQLVGTKKLRVWRIETGVTRLPADELRKWAQALRIKPERLLP